MSKPKWDNQNENSNRAAMPITHPGGDGLVIANGFSKREYMATHILMGLCAVGGYGDEGPVEAVRRADLLLAELAKVSADSTDKL